MIDANERKQGAFKNEGTIYHNYDDGGLDHAYFVDSIIHAIEKLLGAATLGSYIANNYDHTVENSPNKSLIGPSSGKRIPDYYFYEQNKYIILGEAKATKEDLKDTHTNDQLSDYYRYLYGMVNIDTEAKPMLILGIPYELVGEARKKVLRVKKYLLENGEIGKKFIDSVGVIYATEIDGKNIPSPQGFDINAPLYNTEYSKSNIVLDNVTYHAYESIMKIDDLCYDEDNTRIATISLSHTYNQKECEEKLLMEDEVKTRSLRNAAIIRRQSILKNGSIYNHLEVFEHADKKGNTIYTVIDGNSRLALCRDILRRSHSAPSYSIVPVKIYREQDGITRDTIEKIKERSQHDPKLEHSKSSIACKMREKSAEKMDIRDIADMFNVSINITELSIKTIKKLDTIKYDQDEDFEHIYDIAYSIVSSFNASKSDKACDGFNVNTVLSKTLKDKKLQRFFDRNKEGRRGFLPDIISKRTKKTPAQQKVLLKWLKGEYNSEAELSGDWEVVKSSKNNNVANALKKLDHERASVEHLQDMLNAANREKGGLIKYADPEKLDKIREDARVMGQAYLAISHMFDNE